MPRMRPVKDPDIRLLQAAADPVRLRILRQLADVGPVCACDIAAGQLVTQPTVSHHLRVLRDAGWISGERRGTWIYYSLRQEAALRLRAIAEAVSPGSGPSPRLPRLHVVQPGA
jgi:ArsR family transcriptional regulator, arsenate/arsenite/antimonite-responsive transcriptional repressor